MEHGPVITIKQSAPVPRAPMSDVQVMAQREGDCREIKDAKWDFNSLMRMERDYGFDFSPQLRLLLEYVRANYQAQGFTA